MPKWFLKKRTMTKMPVLLLIFSAAVMHVNGQETHHYKLVQLLTENKLDTSSRTETHPLNDSIYKEAISTKRLVYLKDVSFSRGTIEVDIRGKDVFLQSFLGVAFHGVDTTTYDAVYFRPFNFRHPDSLRRKWSVQYFSIPEYDYDRLRKEHPLVYENAVTPVPLATDWFHATIVINDEWVMVYVNHSTTASLKVKLLNNRANGKIGLWDDGVSGDFANLTLIQ
jgi:hypothetical protein